jgi:outer membrane lipoprotein-sorting protein
MKSLTTAFTVVALAALSAMAVRPANACTADSVLTLLEERVQSYETIRADYSKEAHSLLFGERPSEKGTLWLGPPSRYRIETRGQVYVRGIDTLWTYSEASQQVTIRTGDLDSLEFGPAGFFGSLSTDFIPVDCEEITGDKKAKQWHLRLVAKTETAAIQRLTLWVDMKSHLPTATEYVDYNEETTQLRFFDYRFDQAKDSQQFTFNPPPKSEVIVLPVKKAQRNSDSER